MMLSDLDKTVGVVLFVNTSLPESEGRYYGVIFNELWKHALALRDRAPRTAS